MGEELARGLQALTRATQLDAQLRYGEAVQAYRDGIALLYLAYGDSFRQTLLQKIGEYQRRADQLAMRLAAGARPPPSSSAAQPPSHHGLDIPKHALAALASTGTAGPPTPGGLGGGLPQHHFADEEDRALMERVMQLRVDVVTSSAGGGGQGGGHGSQGGGRSVEDVDREYRERVNRLAGREVIADPSAATRPSILDAEELTEEEQIERILNAVHDDVRLEILGGPVAVATTPTSSSLPSAKKKNDRPGHRRSRRRGRRASDSDTSDDSSTDESGDDDESDGTGSSNDDEEAERRRRRRARMEQERDLTFGQKWELRKKEREERKAGRRDAADADPLREREKAFMAMKEKEERDKERKYRAEFIKKWGM
ncbi:MIT domain containing protein [Acanthamoeba castellanii str. Neff]|uniref:MIT domain containing protein n=1 Tax=Acanthamoeba castellanii (strain ATCC 30010 / Neff) TaxID=1257118 RepID=L8HD30_ACACF|nr:MIT domain containing protein [Acanthamoeba castellanii str. Neff]ELR22306.1 MIT domain containing protein [Acanthamoeba castellanii str. Neff]